MRHRDFGHKYPFPNAQFQALTPTPAPTERTSDMKTSYAWIGYISHAMMIIWYVRTKRLMMCFATRPVYVRVRVRARAGGVCITRCEKEDIWLCRTLIKMNLQLEFNWITGAVEIANNISTLILIVDWNKSTWKWSKEKKRRKYVVTQYKTCHELQILIHFLSINHVLSDMEIIEWIQILIITLGLMRPPGGITLVWCERPHAPNAIRHWLQ